MTLLARQRDMGVTLRLDLSRRTLSREMDFSAFGTGLQISYTNDSISLYARPRWTVNTASAVTPLALDLTRFDDAVTNTSSTTFGLTWRFLRSAHQDWSLTGGMIDGAIVDDVALVSVALGLHN